MENNPKLSDIFPLPAEAKKLQVFLGDWIVEGTLTFEGKPLKVKGLWKFTSIAAGWGVLNVGKLEIEGLGMYEEADIFGFDSGDSSYHIFSVTNTASTHDHKGRWVDDSKLIFVYEGLQEGKSYREEIEINILSPKKLAIQEKDSLGGQVISAMDIALVK